MKATKSRQGLCSNNKSPCLVSIKDGQMADTRALLVLVDGLGSTGKARRRRKTEGKAQKHNNATVALQAL